MSIRTWTIRPGGEMSAEGEEDTNQLLRVLNTHPELVQSFARPEHPEIEAIKVAMRARIAEVLARQESEPADGAAHLLSSPPKNPLRMSEARTQYEAACKRAKLAERTVIERQRLLEQLSACVVKLTPSAGDDPYVHDIGAHHLSALLDDMSKKAGTDGVPTEESASPRTLLKKISTLRAFFEWAHDEKLATVDDPTAGLAKRDKDLRQNAAAAQEHYHPFETEHLTRIFQPEAYLAFNNQPDYFWAPLLGLHLGTRLKEIITLELAAIAMHEPTRIWFMDVKPEHAKNANSIRRLPIPTRLIELGFIEYVERLRKLGATRLFPHRDFTSTTTQRDPSKNCSRRFGSYLDTLGLTDSSLVFHSFRHTVVTALQDASTPLSDSMQITGHQAQEHAIRTGRMTAVQAQSVHVKTYTHADRARLNVEYPLARLQGHLDNIKMPLDYGKLRRAATVVTNHVVKTAKGFSSGWHTLQEAHTREQLQRLAEE